MDIASVISFAQNQPWWALVVFVFLAWMDGNLGALTALKRGEKFSFQRYVDFEETSVGAHQLALVAGSAVLVYLTKGMTDGWVTLLALVATGAPAYAAVLADVLQKAGVLAGFLADPKKTG